MLNLLRENAVLALFACLALGYLVGKLRVGPITLGGICGTLIVSMLIGAQHVSVNADVKNVAFALFIFSLGYIAGPGFVANLNAKGLRFGVLSIMEAVVVVVIAVVITKVGGLDVGTGAGILAGAATESAVVGTAQEAITELSGITEQQATQLQAHVATAYSVCYLFGLITIVLLTSQLFPRLMKINLADASRELWHKMRGGDATLEEGQEASMPALVGRTYEVAVGDGATVQTLEESVQLHASIEGVKRGTKVLTVSPELKLRTGDRVLVVGKREGVMGIGESLGPETSGVPGIESPLTVRELVLTEKKLAGQTVAAVNKAYPVETEGVYLTGLQRVGQDLPASGETELHHGDTLTVVGTASKVDRFQKKFGAKVRTESADWVYIGFGICLGVLLGQIVVHIGDANLTLGTGGGCLISGLVFGWFRSTQPTFGAYPPVAAQTMKDLGLAMFIAVTGLAAGPDAGPLLKQYPLLLPLSGIAMVVIPAFLGLWIGRKFLKIDKPILIGAIAGQQCSTPAITAVTNTANSSVPMLGYTITYTLSNFLLPLTGPIFVGIIGLQT
ncbi:aspartate-alanine antiporter [Yinghuangia soli]|uniref:Aspartate-alanine antiporter n=1 Tax=Yinghuangia soli TaxID=2908204 RepID=A0AA41TZV3_9ACTN|nr:aspartate-alanine antiporter [Yinghuangia soli]MCF2525752.1 aspartate-alanine antiporter [Yinghuangia soli]